MITWNNLDTLASFKELERVKHVNLAEVMSGENGAERVKNYSVPMAEGLAYNYAAKAGRRQSAGSTCRNWLRKHSLLKNLKLFTMEK